MVFGFKVKPILFIFGFRFDPEMRQRIDSGYRPKETATGPWFLVADWVQG